MIELTAAAVQVVPAGESVVFTNEAVKGGCAERHRDGSAQITLLQPGRYLVTFSGNIAIDTGGTAGEISLALTQQGEILGGSRMRVTPAAVGEYFNVATQHYIDVYRGCNGAGCCQTITVENTSAQAVLVDNPNITAVRVCG